MQKIKPALPTLTLIIKRKQNKKEIFCVQRESHQDAIRSCRRCGMVGMPVGQRLVRSMHGRQGKLSDGLVYVKSLLDSSE